MLNQAPASQNIINALAQIANNDSAPFKTTSSGKTFANARFANHYKDTMRELVNTTNALNDTGLIYSMADVMTESRYSEILHDVMSGLIHEIRVFEGDIPTDPRNKGAINNLIKLAETTGPMSLMTLPMESTTYIGYGFFTSHRTLQQSFVRVFLAACMTYRKEEKTGACMAMEELISAVTDQEFEGMMMI